MQLTLPYPPSTNRYWRTFRSRLVISEEARKYKANAAQLGALAGLGAPLTGPVCLEANLSPKRPQRPSKRPVRCMDLDNALKVVIDALQGIAYINDSQIVRIIATRIEPSTSGQIHITVTPHA